MKEKSNMNFEISKIKLGNLFKIIIEPYLPLIVICLVESLILLTIGQYAGVINFWMIMMFGVFGSFVLHEYTISKRKRRRDCEIGV